MMKIKETQGNIAAVLLALAAGPLWAGTEGASSTFYGQSAGASGSSGSGADTFVGYSAGFTNTGANNTFVGYGAGFYNTTGNSNTFLGMHAGLNSNNSNNTFLGVEAGLNNTDGNSNTFVGFQAGYSNNGGFSNTYLGPFAERSTPSAPTTPPSARLRDTPTRPAPIMSSWEMKRATAKPAPTGSTSTTARAALVASHP
jgi:hypothetical protein